jgi:hypothetical protein
MVAALYVDYILSLAIQPWGIMKNSISIDGIANILLVDGVVRSCQAVHHRPSISRKCTPKVGPDSTQLVAPAAQQ